MSQRAAAVSGLTALTLTLASSTTEKGFMSSDDGTARLLGGLGLAVGIIGLAVGAYGLTRRRTS